jgi:hypothetical protein
MDRGNVLKGSGLYFDPAQEEETIFYSGWGTNPNVPAMFDGGGSNSRWYRASVVYNNLFNNIPGQNANLTGGNGLGHEQPFLLEEQNDVPQTSITLHAGKPHQRANQYLIEKANTDEFIFQDSGYALDKSAYWTNNHRVLDTAYIVSKFLVTEGEYSVPDLEFVVKGKFIQCYNYDGSFAPFYPEDHPTVPQDDTLAANFQLGTQVEIQGTADDGNNWTVLNNTAVSPTTIIDRFYFYDKTGRKQWRFRLASPISDTDKGIYNRFRIIEQDSGNLEVWEFAAYDYKKIDGQGSGISLPSRGLSANEVSSALDGNNNLALTYTSPDTFYSNLYDVLYDSLGDIRKDAKNVPLDIYLTINDAHTFKVLSVVDPATLGGGSGTITLAAESSLYERYRLDVDQNSLNTLHLSNVILDTQTFANLPIEDDIVELEYVASLGAATQIFNNTVAAYVSPINQQSSINATILHDFNLPSTAFGFDSVALNVTPAESDFRVSINPAMQLLDYITAERYGAGLDVDNDIDLESFTDAATLCDSTSDVIMRKDATSVDPAEGDTVAIYYTDGTLMWQGTYAGKYTDLDGNQYGDYYLFTDCIGKIGRKLNNYTLYKSGEIVWNNGSAYIATQDFSTYVTASDLGGAGFSALGNILNLDNLTNPSNVVIDIRDSIATAEGNPIVRGPGGQPGYSLHDSDLVQYWKYVK